MTATDVLQQGREAIERQDWRQAYESLSAADHAAPLEAEDLERLSIASYMLGKEDECVAALERAHHEWVRLGDIPRSCRCAFWMAFTLMFCGEIARSSGWISRGRRLLDEQGLDCVERGYLMLPPAVQQLHMGEFEASAEAARTVVEIARRFGDEELRIMADLGVGGVLIRTGRAEEGFALLDELMVSAGTGVLTPMAMGMVYCAAIECCQDVFDLNRAQVWTDELGRWCASQKGLVPYYRECLVHRSEILLLRGAWSEALEEAQRAADLTSDRGVAASALYQQAEVHRLRGEFALAEESYRLCSRAGHSAQPGLALLRIAQGQAETAAAAIRVLLDGAADALARSKLLPAQVEATLGAGDIAAARAAADELRAISADLQSPLLRAASQYATGAVLLAEGDARGALTELRRAFLAWQAIEAPYEAARARVLIAVASRQLGDHDTAELELDAARWVFERFAAAPDIARVEALAPGAASKAAGGLTERELEVLRLVAAGKTNQAIAADLVVSEHTVRRHLQNIFSKIGVSSRSAATAFAFQQKLT
jgi:ATP/maltotriose-dependent transcriptional regulator MalT